MTNADMIRQMSNDELIELLVWGGNYGTYCALPDCEEECEDFRNGCANGCTVEKKEEVMRKWLEAEVK